MQDETTDEFCLAFEAAIPQLKQIILNSFQYNGLEKLDKRRR